MKNKSCGKLNKVAGVVVLYHPDKNVIYNIKSYIDFVEILYVVDNSEFKNDADLDLIKLMDKVVYVDNNGNQGIAHALNISAKKAIEAGYDWLLTMDQDSVAVNDIVFEMFTGAEHNFIVEDIAIISPTYLSTVADVTTKSNYSSCFTLEDVRNSLAASRVVLTMTSGNILNLNVFQKIGQFKNAYFIDHIDHEYCLRSKKYGYAIVEVASAMLQHAPGIDMVGYFFGRRLVVTKHSSSRYYYQMRNLIWLSKAYYRTDAVIINKLLNNYLRNFLKVILISPLYEKWCCVKYCIAGLFYGLFTKPSD